MRRYCWFCTLLALYALFASPAYAQLQSLNTTHTASELRVELRFQGTWQWHRVYIDTDDRRSTGFQASSVSVGAEFLLEGERAYRYTGTGTNWSWVLLASYPSILGSGTWSMIAPRSVLGLDSGRTIALHGNLERSGAQSDFGPTRYVLASAPAPLAPINPPTPPQAPTPPTPPQPPSPVPPPSSLAQLLGLPAYIWAGDSATWNRVLATSAQDLDLLIVNPNSGPGSARDARVASNVQRARQQGRRVIGYIATSRGAKPINQVQTEIDRYFSWYAVNGVFLDETAVNCGLQGYYQAIRDHVRARQFDTWVVSNPGGVFPECLMPTADVFMSFETDFATYLGTPPEWVLPSFARNYPRERFWHVVHNAPQASIAAVVERSRQLHVGRLWITNDSGANPYDSFPSVAYYNALRAAMRAP